MTEVTKERNPAISIERTEWAGKTTPREYSMATKSSYVYSHKAKFEDSLISLILKTSFPSRDAEMFLLVALTDANNKIPEKIGPGKYSVIVDAAIKLSAKKEKLLRTDDISSTRLYGVALQNNFEYDGKRPIEHELHDIIERILSQRPPRTFINAISLCIQAEN